ncbi:putative aminotransferase TAT2 [Nicotiana tabacum]|uniref:Aminotransferase TAT2 n=1 Tax=Nicotiana tabacum TaxID=4097 RepID=A0A1S4CXL8_TOBAC|nr:probable aminotransferase TAT2 [Nicotiana tomentosiformis]XP_016505883.1 PREDICTED: probable aminotransferase TAT2 [Nicotiana tabacum]
MENKLAKWGFNNGDLKEKSLLSIRSVLETIMENLKEENERKSVIHLGRGDPSAIPCFRTSPVAENALFSAVRSAKFNGYAPAVGLYSARRSIAEYLSHDLPHQLSPDDVFLTPGANHAIEVVMAVLARPGANILLPKPGYPFYEARAAVSNVEVRHFDLLPEKGWEVDLGSLESLVDDNTIAIVIINPGNPCGNVFFSEHLQEVAETAKKLGILVIADEVYNHLCFGSKPFVPMGVFGSITPILTLGSLSKRWIIPGWRLGWMAMVDPSGILKKSGLAESLQSYLDYGANPATIIQGAVPHILETTTKDFFSNINNILREAVDVFITKIQEMPCFTCPYKPDGAMSVMFKLNLSYLEGINDDMDFCTKLVHEESVIVLPGVVVGLKNWLRLTFAIEPSILEEGLERIKAFCLRHSRS